ncbi:PREDICTED: EPIDERMAL PATTERNING FACTOR-like protein 6-like [Fragaria vesca subsp. vesca]
MAPSTRNYPVNGLKIAILTVAFIFFFFFTILLSKSVDSEHSIHSESSTDQLQQRKMVLGSRPPQCENKCLNCRPCFATLVIPSHHKTKVYSSSHNDGDDRYYLLSWKCKCGQKLFQP